MNDRLPDIGPDCGSALSRRQFVRSVGAAATALAGAPLIARAAQDPTGPKPTDPAETAVARFFATLSKEQRELIAFPFDHPKRTMVNNNWAIVKPMISDLTTEQQALCREIMKGVTSEEGFDRFMRQMDDDAGGFDNYHVAVFGEPGNGKPFEWVLSGRHDTLRADGNSVEGLAFGGPIFYGHDPTGTGNDDPRHTKNVWWYQGEQANAIFASLDDKQKAVALVEAADPDAPKSIRLRGEDVTKQPGIAIATLDGQQKDMVTRLVDGMLTPFRACDAAEVKRCLADAGGVEALRLTYYKQGDIGSDGTWDIWRLEGPAFSWYFHGSPHVHTWLHVASDASRQGSLES